MIEEIDGEPAVYRSDDRISQGGSSSIHKQFPAPKELVLKKDTQVMLVKNLTKQLVNDTVGTVVGFVKPRSSSQVKSFADQTEKLPVVRFTLADGMMRTLHITRESWETFLPDGKVQCRRVQIPLILAWAITIHKSQS